MDQTDEKRLRPQLNAWLEQVGLKLDLQNKSVLEIGIAGDEKPSGGYRYFGKGNKWTTLDKEQKWDPDIVADITNNRLGDETYDMVLMTQALEHIWDYKTALSEIYRVTRDYAIIDCPFKYNFHQDHLRPAPWKEWDDYWRFTPAAMYKLLTGVGFQEVEVMFSPLLTLTICRKNKHSS